MRRFACVLAGALVLFASCGKDNPVQAAPETQRQPQSQIRTLSPYTWYYFDTAGIKKTDSVRNVPVVAKRPWTEVVRISSASVAADIGSEPPKGYAIVNRLGIIEFDKNDFELFPDASLFSNRTAGNLVFYDNLPVYSLYRNYFFNETSENFPVEFHPFLGHFSTTTHVSAPLLAIENLKLNRESEITDFVWDGTVWLCSIKTVSGDRTTFSYVALQPRSPLLSLTPANATQSLFITESERDVFRSMKSPENFSAAPLRLRNLLSQIPSDISFHVTCYTAGGHSPRQYISQDAENESLPLIASACIAETWICAVFQDGTVYLQGALYDEPFFRNGETVAFKLPQLPAGYIYSDFVITGESLFVSWEETAFYQTGRSGFVSVDLDLIVR